VAGTQVGLVALGSLQATTCCANRAGEMVLIVRWERTGTRGQMAGKPTQAALLQGAPGGDYTVARPCRGGSTRQASMELCAPVNFAWPVCSCSADGLLGLS